MNQEYSWPFCGRLQAGTFDRHEVDNEASQSLDDPSSHVRAEHQHTDGPSPEWRSCQILGPLRWAFAMALRIPLSLLSFFFSFTLCG